ncbi:MAG: S1C family serine protease [Gemmatimonadales bacterium]
MSPTKPRNALSELSTQLADAVETAARSVVAIHARRRIPSSGIMWRDDVIVSASHTVQRDEEIPVTLPSGETARVAIAGRDPATDLVALRLKGARWPVAPRAGAGSLRVGAPVLAVGRPGREVSASFGIISAVREGWRTWRGTRLDRVLRLDLNVYDGFSGGPLVDASGAVLGIDNSALARGTPLALPGAEVDRVLEQLLERGHVRRAFVGIAVQPVALGAKIIAKHALPAETALVVVSVADGSPAEVAGVAVGDVLIDAAGTPFEHATDLLDALAAVPEGGSLAIKRLRGGAIGTVSVAPADRAAGGGPA